MSVRRLKYPAAILMAASSACYGGFACAQTQLPCTTVKECADSMVAMANQLTQQNNQLSKRVLDLETALANLKNAVVAFDSNDKCPEGWSLFDSGAGRVIVGAGQGGGLSTRDYAEKHGNETITIVDSNLPPYTVVNESINAGPEQAFYYVTRVIPGAQDSFPDIRQPYNVNFIGGNAANHQSADPIDIMPPYVALYFCKKK
jgi:hypothetical protein